MKTRKIPQRMCMACREKKDKRDLIRIVRTVDGTIVLDDTGKKSGRGAYICPKAECFKKVRKNKGLERALEVKFTEDIYDSLEREVIAKEARASLLEGKTQE